MLTSGVLRSDKGERRKALNISPLNESRLTTFVDNGRDENVDDVLERALDLLSRQDASEALRAEIVIGIKQFRDGDVVNVDETFWNDLDREIDQAFVNEPTSPPS